ncbi:MAG: hypothetical protein EZS28_028770 [Streblomastix strix]|uniref:Uncharacterized protein n=1 Tax=Streblomastix strix TaxID=222440 RepID=A0A5J4UZP6_9EUKA|nr:MAG: hypothetical protein EZS28_028770 [Streblomastix strix]
MHLLIIYHIKAIGEYLEANTTLDSAILRFNPIGDKGGISIAKSFSKNVTIKAIDFARCGVGDGTMEALRQAFRESSASLLSDDDYDQKKPKRRQSALVAILLEHNDLGPAGLESLSNALLESVQTHHIEQLSLYDCRNIDHVGPIPNVDGIKSMGRLLASGESALTNLDLGSCNLDDCGVQALSDSLSTAPKLKFLSLQKNKLTNISATNLRDALKTNNVLEEIDLRANKFTDDGMSAFIELLALNNTLKDVDIRGIAISTVNPTKLKNEIYPRSRIEVLKWVDKKQNITADEISELRKRVMYDPTPRKIAQARNIAAQQQPESIQRTGSNPDINAGNTPQRNMVTSSSIPDLTSPPPSKTTPKAIAPGLTKAAKK